MPALPVAELNSLTRTLYLPVLIDQVYNSNVLLMRLKKRAKFLDGGDKIRQPLVLAKNTQVLAYSGLQTWDISATSELSAADYDWVQYGAPITIDGKTEALNSGDNAVINILTTKIKTAEKSLQDSMGTDLFSTNTTASSGFWGLRAAVDDGTNTGTYAGVSRTDWAVWKAQYFANGGTNRALTFALLQQAYGAATVDNDRPTLGITGQRLFDKFHSMVLPAQRVSNDELTSAGFKNLAYNGMIMVVDSHVPANQMFLLNENWIEFWVHKDRNFEFQPFVPLTNQDGSTAKIRFMGAVGVTNPRMNSRIVDLSPTL